MAAELAIVDARVRTLDPARPFATRRGGPRRHDRRPSASDVREHCDARTEVIDARGAALVPGLVDSHIHPFWGAELARGLDLSHVRTQGRGARGAGRASARSAAGCSPGGWTTTRRRRPRRSPRRSAAPRSSCGWPTCTARWPRRGRSSSRRSTGPVDFPDGSEVVCVRRRPHGRAARAGRAGAGPARRAARCAGRSCAPRHVAQLRRLNALGLTGAHVMDGEPETFELLRDLEGTGELTHAPARPAVGQTPDTQRRGSWRRGCALRDERGGLWRGGVAKFFADGVIDAGTAWLEAPDTHGEGLTPFWPDPERMARRDGALRRAPASSSRRTRSATPPCASRSTPTSRGAAAAGHRLEHLETLPDDLVRAIARRRRAPPRCSPCT